MIGSCLFGVSAFVILWAMGGYACSLKLLGKILKNRKLEKDMSKHPTVSVMIVAHNEEQVILDKLNNVVDNDYPKELIDYIIASDFSTDRTNEIAEQFIKEHPELKIQLHKTREHKGKTNAQNEAQKLTSGEILVMTDANAMFERSAISQLVSCFTEDSIAYVTGRLVYKNAGENETASLESTYWEGDLAQREIESNIHTITAGNGAIYACRNAVYHDFEPIKCHDSSMPFYYALKGKRAIYNPDAVAYEKAGEKTEDEFKRKVRMYRGILKSLKDSLKVLDIRKYGWFSYFYFGHRTCRYLLWLAHSIVFAVSALKTKKSLFHKISFWGQSLFYLAAGLNYFVQKRGGNFTSDVQEDIKSNGQNVITISQFLGKLLNLSMYYSMTILAQWKGVYNCITGRSKPTWDKVDSTR